MNETGAKIYILGASGFLGRGCADYFRSRGYTVFDNKIDVTDFQSLRRVFADLKPDFVINFAGVRAVPNIDWCEDHKEETVMVNVAGAINVMLAALEAGAYPVQISSGCIYSGGPDRRFSEEDEPNFFGSFYSRMRIVLREALKDLPVLIGQIRMPLTDFSHPRNLINKITSYEKVISIPNSVTFVPDLYSALEKMLRQRPTGILNLTNDGYIEHKNILEAYRALIDPGHKCQIISVSELENGIVKAKRSNCVLDNSKAKALGLSMPAIDRPRLELIMKNFRDSRK